MVRRSKSKSRLKKKQLGGHEVALSDGTVLMHHFGHSGPVDLKLLAESFGPSGRSELRRVLQDKLVLRMLSALTVVSEEKYDRKAETFRRQAEIFFNRMMTQTLTDRDHRNMATWMKKNLPGV